MWRKYIENAYFREDFAYAGKDHTRNDKTFIIINPITLGMKKGFKTIKSAIKAADKKWPLQ